MNTCADEWSYLDHLEGISRDCRSEITAQHVHKCFQRPFACLEWQRPGDYHLNSTRHLQVKRPGGLSVHMLSSTVYFGTRFISALIVLQILKVRTFTRLFILQVQQAGRSSIHLHEMEGAGICGCQGRLRPHHHRLLLHLPVAAGRQHTRAVLRPQINPLPVAGAATSQQPPGPYRRQLPVLLTPGPHSNQKCWQVHGSTGSMSPALLRANSHQGHIVGS